MVDSTLAPPVICRPLEHGADLVVHSATKYIGGHSDVTGGVVTGSIELIGQIRATRIDTGGSLSPDDAFQLRRGLETLPVRVRRQSATASVFAATLAKHPAVAYVDYPGLPTHPGHELARRTFDAGPEGVRFGAVVTVTPFGGREAGLAFASGLRLAARRPRSAARTRSSRTWRRPRTASSMTGHSPPRASTLAPSASPSAWKTRKT